MPRKKIHPLEADLRSSAYEWVHKIPSLTQGNIDVVPEGWITNEKYSEMMNIPQKTSEYQLKEACKRGELQRKQFRIQTHRCKVLVWHYYKKDQ